MSYTKNIREWGGLNDLFILALRSARISWAWSALGDTWVFWMASSSSKQTHTYLDHWGVPNLSHLLQKPIETHLNLFEMSTCQLKMAGRLS